MQSTKGNLSRLVAKKWKFPIKTVKMLVLYPLNMKSDVQPRKISLVAAIIHIVGFSKTTSRLSEICISWK